ncbi:MAG: hypothetical protein RIQ99_1349 [Pseudomonadota bacterium]|jgi:hypothetical protein
MFKPLLIAFAATATLGVWSIPAAANPPAHPADHGTDNADNPHPDDKDHPDASRGDKSDGHHGSENSDHDGARNNKAPAHPNQ